MKQIPFIVDDPIGEPISKERREIIKEFFNSIDFGSESKVSFLIMPWRDDDLFEKIMKKDINDETS